MQDLRRYRAGLIGTGYISEYHIAALRRLPNVDLVGVCDVDLLRAKKVAEKAGVAAFVSPAELRNAGAEVMHILTPPNTHAALTLESLDLGCHVLVEKPLAVDVAECRCIEAVAAKNNLSVCVNHSLLFDPQIRRALTAVRTGKIGTVIGVDIIRSSVYPPYEGGKLPPQYRQAGYPFRDLGIHALYLMEAFLGPIQQVQADWASLGGDANLAFDEWRAQVHCRDGLGQFQLSWNAKPLQSQLLIHGTKGLLRVDLFLMFQSKRASLPVPKAAERVINALTDSIKPLVDVPRGVLGYVTHKILPYHGLQDLVAAFYRSLEEGGPVPVSVAEATRVVKWTEQVARTAEGDYENRIRPLVVSDSVPVLVTGASGALGSEIVKRLQAEGKRVRLMVRRVPKVVQEGTEVVLGNLGDPEAVGRAVRGAKVVIHAGAAMKGGWEEHLCGTVTGTQNVIDACLRYGVEKLVHVSSMSVVDWAGGDRNTAIDEESPLEPRPGDRGHYTRAKLEAEILVRKAVRDKGLRGVILRPGQIFGGKIPILTGAVARRMGKRWLVLGNGNVRLPLIHMDDVVSAIVQAADGEIGEGQIIQLVAEGSPTQNDVIQLVIGKDVAVVRVPRWAVFFGGWMSEKVLGLLKRKSPLSRYRLRSALSDRPFRSLNAGLLEGWRPRLEIREAVRRAGAGGKSHTGDTNVVVDSAIV